MNSKFEKGKRLAELHLGEEGFQRAMDAAPELTHLCFVAGFYRRIFTLPQDCHARIINYLGQSATVGMAYPRRTG